MGRVLLPPQPFFKSWQPHSQLLVEWRIKFIISSWVNTLNWYFATLCAWPPLLKLGVHLQRSGRFLGITGWEPTSHIRLRARDHYTSSTLIGGNGGAGPSSLLHTYAWGTDGVCVCKMEAKSTWIPTWHRKDHVSWSLGLFSKTTCWR